MTSKSIKFDNLQQLFDKVFPLQPTTMSLNPTLANKLSAEVATLVSELEDAVQDTQECIHDFETSIAEVASKLLAHSPDPIVVPLDTLDHLHKLLLTLELDIANLRKNLAKQANRLEQVLPTRPRT